MKMPDMIAAAKAVIACAGDTAASSGPLRVEDIVDPQNQNVEQVTAQQITDRHVDGAEPQRADGYHQFRHRGGAGDQQRADEACRASP